ncbi:MAG: hypothetical protein VX777_07860 [Chlamydiota bacterium]|nr:hypothetical protein [Chlamydiota bacterium]
MTQTILPVCSFKSIFDAKGLKGLGEEVSKPTTKITFIFLQAVSFFTVIFFLPTLYLVSKYYKKKGLEAIENDNIQKIKQQLPNQIFNTNEIRELYKLKILFPGKFIEDKAIAKCKELYQPTPPSPSSNLPVSPESTSSDKEKNQIFFKLENAVDNTDPSGSKVNQNPVHNLSPPQVSKRKTREFPKVNSSQIIPKHHGGMLFTPTPTFLNSGPSIFNIYAQKKFNTSTSIQAKLSQPQVSPLSPQNIRKEEIKKSENTIEYTIEDVD